MIDSALAGVGGDEEHARRQHVSDRDQPGVFGAVVQDGNGVRRIAALADGVGDGVLVDRNVSGRRGRGIGRDVDTAGVVDWVRIGF